MSSVAATPFHLGPELGRAINRTDFFRLLKAAAQHYRFECFALARVSEASPPFSTREIIITNVAERRTALFLYGMRQALGLRRQKPRSFSPRRFPEKAVCRKTIRATSSSTNLTATPSSSFPCSRRRASVTASLSAASAPNRIRQRWPKSFSTRCGYSISSTRRYWRTKCRGASLNARLKS